MNDNPVFFTDCDFQFGGLLHGPDLQSFDSINSK